jgi:hypothetical protein
MDLTQFAELLLGSSTPRDAAERTLRWIKEEYSARSVSLWQNRDGALVLELSLGLDADAMAGAAALFASNPNAIVRGEPIVDGSQVLIPARSRGFCIYLDSVDARRIDLAIAAEGATVAVNALRRKATTQQRRPGRLGSEEMARDELIATLRLHEWNLARVARVKGVTRKTIYDWLEKYRIPRERVRKT